MILHCLVVTFVACTSALHTNSSVVTLADLPTFQRKSLNEFKESVAGSLPHEYMKQDDYLINFLHYHNFSVPKANHLLKSALTWRRTNRIDELFKARPAHFTKIMEEFPVNLKSTDRDGRPICEIPFGSWRLREAAAKSIMKDVISHLIVECVEGAITHIREQQALGKNVTQWILIADMKGFDFYQHSCSSCMKLFLNLVTGIDRYYPRTNYGIWLINAPPSVNELLRRILPVMSPYSRGLVKAFGPAETGWEQHLVDKIQIGS